MVVLCGGSGGRTRAAEADLVLIDPEHGVVGVEVKGGPLRLTRVLRAGPVREIGLLDAACARPRASAFGDEAYPSLGLKSAALLHPLVRNPALVDGNKRLGWLATVVFLDLNGSTVDLDDDAACSLVMAAAEGALVVEVIARRLDLRPRCTACHLCALTSQRDSARSRGDGAGDRVAPARAFSDGA